MNLNNLRQSWTISDNLSSTRTNLADPGWLIFLDSHYPTIRNRRFIRPKAHLVMFLFHTWFFGMRLCKPRSAVRPSKIQAQKSKNIKVFSTTSQRQIKYRSSRVPYLCNSLCTIVHSTTLGNLNPNLYLRILPSSIADSTSNWINV